ncbi:MAG: APC family permease [Chloroflexi bacterium]|nr:APC family permease [Ktedonobacteraceae bacterium]MBV9708030.1 APC family permease [Chloroflexota bacterium]
MAQESVEQEATHGSSGDEHNQEKSMLGPLLCWAVVFADIGTSVYYVPGILYGTRGVGSLAGFFVFLTMSVFVLLTLKYAEVTHRFPQGGGVVTVAAQAMNRWMGALGGMFILVDYFLTAAISCLSGMQYLSVVIPILGVSLLVPGLGQLQLLLLLLTIAILILLGILNWIGIKESARVSFVGAVIAFVSDIAILFTVFTHISFSYFLSLFPKMFVGHILTPSTILIGFASSFLAFSGLESISQLSPVMKQPHKKVAGMALLLVVLTIGITSPLLTMLSTLLLPRQAADPIISAYIISLLGGRWGGIVLQTEVAISATALLVFASNTAIIGSYHVFIALSRMEFLPSFILRRNKLRGTPHYSIILATAIPIVILILVLGNINILGDMYAFGLLGAFSLTCLGLDIVRYQDWKTARRQRRGLTTHREERSNSNKQLHTDANKFEQLTPSVDEQSKENGHINVSTAVGKEMLQGTVSEVAEAGSLWFKINFWLGIVTTLLVVVAWSTNLVAKPLATAFGGGVTVLGLIVAYTNSRLHERRGRVPVPVVFTRIGQRIPNSVLAVLTAGNGHNDAVIRAALHEAEEKTPVSFLYLTNHRPQRATPTMMEIVDPYLDDEQAKEYFGKAESLALKAKVANRRFFYLEEQPDALASAWHVIQPHDTVIAAVDDAQAKDINPDRIRYELTPNGKVAHLLKTW